ncbi:MAG: hypothetical protein FWE69_06215 [Clostridiales bacterium]|nr:hypothetical protein [Clostridiales bacterium]
MKRKSQTRAWICALLAAALLLSLGACGKKEDRVFGSEELGVQLNADGTFTANLYHNDVKIGTYTEEKESNGVVIVAFVVDGEETLGTIVGNVLTIPEQWRDAHGHSSKFPLQ